MMKYPFKIAINTLIAYVLMYLLLVVVIISQLLIEIIAFPFKTVLKVLEVAKLYIKDCLKIINY